jgi:sterol 3beta-glucosyltransferase
LRVAIVTVGSRGDVQPYLALARGLIDAGHDATVATHHRFHWLADALDVPLTPLQHEPLKRYSELARPATLINAGKAASEVRAITLAAFDEWFRAAEGADLLVAHPKVFVAGDIAERLGIPVAFANTLPVTCPTAAFPCCYFFGRSLGRALNRLSYGILPLALAPLRRLGDEWRRSVLQLPARSGRPELTDAHGRPVHHLHGHDVRVHPTPSDWPSSWTATGYWHVAAPRGWTPTRPLADFLADGEPPVYVGFGSMVYRGDRAKLTERIVRPLLAMGERVLLVRGWALSDERLPDDPRVYFMDEYEGPWHGWLFPRTKAVVHHGGPGTFGAALLAGRPQLCCPFGIDQPFWARRSFEMGVAPRPLPRRAFTERRWAERLRALLTTPAYSERAAELAEEMAQEDGVDTAVRALEEIHRRFPDQRIALSTSRVRSHRSKPWRP